MLTRTEEGRWRTVRTPDEHQQKMESIVGSLSDAERKALQALLEDKAAEENPVLKSMVGLEYEHKPVSAGQFYSDDYYLGNVQLWPKLVDDLVELQEGEYEEAIFTGSFGWGKSFMGAAALCYVIYQLSCLRNPQRSYGLDPTSHIYLTFVGPTLQLAQRGIYSKVTEFIKGSPYFRDNFMPRVIKTQTWFPKHTSLIAGSTSSNAGMSLDVYGGVIDEANFFRAQKSDHDLRVMLDRAKLIYESIRRRMENRFMRSGRLPGLLVIDSSAKSQSSFTQQKIKEARYDNRIFVRDYASWHVQPKDRFIGKFFYMAVGDNQVRSRILDNEDEANHFKSLGANVHAVPIEFRGAFEKDMEMSIQDILGVPTSDISFYIQNHGAIREATKEQRHPFLVNEYTLGVTEKLFAWSRVCDKRFVKVQGGFTEERWVPKVNPNAPRAVHLDLSKSGDATGIAMGHIERYVDVVRRDPESGEDVSEQAPIIYIDAMLRILPPPGRDIILGDVRAIIYAFQKHGYHIYRGTSDQYQSLDTLQQFEAKGMESEVLSMDKSSDFYDLMKSALYEKRILAYHYPPWIEELKSLKRLISRSNKVKIDHPMDPKEGATSKDVADAVAGVVANLTNHPPGRVLTGGESLTDMVANSLGGGTDVDIRQRIEQDDPEPVTMPFLTSDRVGPDD